MTEALLDDEAQRDHAISVAAPHVLTVIEDGFHDWKIPSPENCFDGIIEGSPSEEKRTRMIEEALAARSVWKPSDEARALVVRLRQGIGHDVLVEPWSPLMWMLPAEGPYPVVGRCLDVIIRKDSDGCEQAYLKLHGAREVSYPGGSPSLGEYLRAEGDGGTCLCNIGQLCRVRILGERTP
jgi:hypothetical protein